MIHRRPAAGPRAVRRASRAKWSHQANEWGGLSPRSAAQQLVERGLEPVEAANLTAYLAGLAAVEHGWTLDELERLLFVRHLVEHRQLGR